VADGPIEKDPTSPSLGQVLAEMKRKKKEEEDRQKDEEEERKNFHQFQMIGITNEVIEQTELE